MNPVPAEVNAPVSAQVNLLPPEIEAKRTAGRTRVLIVVTFVIFLFALLAAWFLAFSAKNGAVQALEEEQERRPVLMAQLAEYGYVDIVEATYKNSISARSWVGSTDVDWATQLTALNSAFPEDIAWTDIVVSQATPYGPTGAGGLNQDVYDVGGITFLGTSLEHVATADLIDALDALPGFENTWISSKQIMADGDSETAYWEYTGSTRIGFSTLTGRVETQQTEVPPEVLDAVRLSTDPTNRSADITPIPDDADDSESEGQS